jgi:hypothetical protein
MVCVEAKPSLDQWKEGRVITMPSLLEEPGRVDEPQAAQEYAAVLTQVVAAGRPVIVRRNGDDLAAVIPLEHLELVREILAQQDVERLAAQIDWIGPRQALRPPQSWFDGEDVNPFGPQNLLQSFSEASGAAEDR